MRPSLVLLATQALFSYHTSATATLPSCSLDCLETIVPAICGSLLGNLTCLCTDASVAAELTPCALNACNVTDSFRLEAYQAEICGVEVDRSQVEEQLRLFYIMPALTVIFLIARLASRILLGVGVKADDYCMVVAELAYLIDVGTGLVISLNGFGEHTYSLTTAQVTQSLKFFYLSELFYICTLTFTKLSLLLFFRRIFPNATFNLCVWIMIGFVVSSNFSMLMALMFQCVPIHGNWTNWMYKVAPVKCINSYAAIFTLAGFSILQDLLIMALPLPLLWDLHLQWRKKANLFVMFCIGSFVVVCSLIRLPSLLKLENSLDPSYDQAPIAVWTDLEQSVGIICGCLPACRSLIGWAFPALKMSLQGTSKNSSSKYALGYGPNHPRTATTNKGDFVELDDDLTQGAASLRSKESQEPLDEEKGRKSMGHGASVSAGPIHHSRRPSETSLGNIQMRIMQTKTVQVSAQRTDQF